MTAVHSSLLYVITVFLLSTVQGQSSCRTPTGAKGQCVPVQNCEPLLKIVLKKNRNPQEVEYVRNSQCGFQNTNPLVCCPSCTTPDGRAGTCVDLFTCPAMTRLMIPPIPKHIVEFIKNSRCRGSSQYSVCCGSGSDVPDTITTEAPLTNRGGCQPSSAPPDPNTECCGLDSASGNKIFGNVNVRLGDYDMSNSGADCVQVEGGGEDCTEGEEVIPIEEVIPHEEYDPKSCHKRHDIALLRLTKVAPYTDFIRPICLPTTDIERVKDKQTLYAAGWGAVSEFQSRSAVKLQVDLPLVKLQDCQPSYNVSIRNVTLWDGQMCAGGERGKDSCLSDSGGPLMYDDGHLYSLAGIVSFGTRPCGIEGVPGVYTKVFAYLSWINSKIKP